MTKEPSKKKITLNKIHDEKGSRLFIAEINESGDLVFQGQDLGKAVRDILGVSEYEWDWTIKAKDMSLFEEALGNPPDLFIALQEKFSTENSSLLRSFLEDHEIPFIVWTRYGD